MSNKDGQFSILSLSGGGFRGLFTARVLAALECEAGRMVGKEHRPIGECFDLVCGTSIGGILALAVGLRIPMREIADRMEENGGQIFRRGRLLPMKAKYSAAPLKRMVAGILGNHPIAASQNRLLVPAVNYSTGEPQFFKTAHHPDFKRDFRLRMVDVAMATSAAPGFFPMHMVYGTMSHYVDGGLVGNNPAAFGVHESIVFLNKFARNVRVLSIGTMGQHIRVNPSEKANKGFWGWRKELPLLIISMQEQVADNIVRHVLGDRYCHIDEQGLGLDLDVVNKVAIADLTSGAEIAAQKFVEGKARNDFLGHSAEKFEPCYKLEGESHDTEDA